MYRTSSLYRYAKSKRNRSYTPSSRNPNYRYPRNNIRRRFTNIPNALYSTSAPRQMKVVMKYASTYTLTPAASLAASQVFKINSIYDPDQTGSGHQPQGHDQWALIYNNYRVDKFIIKVHTSTDSSNAGYWTIFPSTSVFAITDPVVAAESPASVTKTASVSQNPTLTRTFNPAVVRGISQAEYNADDLFQSPFGSDPSQPLYCHVSYVDALGTTAPSNALIEIFYYCTLSKPSQFDRS